MIYIAGDNGASPEGMINGTPNEFTTFNGVPVPVKGQFLWYDAWGSDRTFPHYSAGWAWATDTPFKWTNKWRRTYGGAVKACACRGRDTLLTWAALRKRQFHHLIDITPTILEATGIPAPEMVNGIKQRPMDGVSMAYTWDKAGANVPSRRTTQYFQRCLAIALSTTKVGWQRLPRQHSLRSEYTAKAPDVMTGYKWELYNVSEDPTEFNDVAAQMPDKLKQMQDIFYAEAKKDDVLPLDKTSLTRWNSPKPDLTGGRTLFTYTGELTGIPNSGAPSILK